jgi:enolase
MAVARAAADSLGVPLYRYLGGAHALQLPVPMANIVNGGQHSDNKIDFQEFMIMPVGADSMREAVRMTAEVFHALKGILKDAGHTTAVGDEGGFAPNIGNEEALEFIMKAIEKAKYRPGEDIMIALDCAASELFDAGTEGIQVLEVRAGPPLLGGRDDRALPESGSRSTRSPRSRTRSTRTTGRGTRASPRSSATRYRSSADDVFVRTPSGSGGASTRARAIPILIKLNQIGTVTETIDAVRMAQNAGVYGRSSRTARARPRTAFIADLAVASRRGQIKTGSMQPEATGRRSITS